MNNSLDDRQSHVAAMSSRKDELLAKKAKLAELKRQRELREEQRTTGGRQSIGGQVWKNNLSIEHNPHSLF